MPKPLRYQNVSCVCGADVRVDSMNRDRHVTCRNCGNTFDFAVTMDSLGQNSRISLILPRGALKTEGESLALSGDRSEPPAAPEPEPEVEAPPPPATVSRKGSSKTIQTLMGHCECGTVFPLIDDGELASMQDCPKCARKYHVVFKLEPGTRQKTAIIVPEKPFVHRRTIAPAPPKAPKGALKAKTIVPGETRRAKIQKTKPPKQTTIAPKSKAPVDVPIGAQAVPCTCGEMFYVRRKDLEQEHTCSSCGKKVRFQESRHPQTLVPILKIRPQ